MTTRDEFDESLTQISCGYTSLVLAESLEEHDEARAKYLKGRKGALAAFDTLTAQRDAAVTALFEIAHLSPMDILGAPFERCQAIAWKAIDATHAAPTAAEEATP